jgi:hypothetical protein
MINLSNMSSKKNTSQKVFGIVLMGLSILVTAVCFPLFVFKVLLAVAFVVGCYLFINNY